MSGHQKIFISRVSREFGEVAEVVRSLLDGLKIHGRTQPSFRQEADSDTTLALLSRYICENDSVLCLIGDLSGGYPSRESLQDAIHPAPPAGAVEQTWSDLLPTGFDTLSYTQWELVLAQYWGKSVYLYFGIDHQPVATDADDLPHQSAFKNYLTKVRSFNRHYFTNGDQLEKFVLRDLWPNTSASKPNNLPYPPIGSLFKGRDEDMDRLQVALEGGTHRAGVGMTAQRAATHGLGGIGKTRLACEYAHKHAGHYDALLFVNAASAETLDRSVGELADVIGEPLGLPVGSPAGAKKDAVEQWLQTNGRFLLILDNIDDNDAALAAKAWLAKITEGHVILTGRLSVWPQGITRLPLDVLSEAAAVEFLMESTGQDADDAEAKENALAIATALDGLALLLGQAAAYINNEGLSLGEYSVHWEKKRVECLQAWDEIENQIAGGDRPYGANVYVTWQTTVEKLGPAARELLEKCAWFAPDPIPEWILGEEKDTLKELVRCGMATWHRYPDVVGEFGRGFVLHRIVQDVTRQRLRSEGRADEVCLTAIEWMITLFSGQMDEVANWSKFDPLAGHAHQLARRGEDVAGSVASEEKADDGHAVHCFTGVLYWSLALWTYSHGRYAEAVDWGRRGVGWLQHSLGPKHPNTLSCRNNLGEHLRLFEKYEEAESEHRAVMFVRERTLGAEHADTLQSRSNLAIVLSLQGKHRVAEAEFRKILAIRERVLGAEHHDTLQSRTNLGAALSAQERYAEALEEHKAVLSVDQRLLGEAHSETLIDRYNVANSLMNLDRKVEALVEAEISYAGFLKELTEEHPLTLKAQELVEKLRER